GARRHGGLPAPVVDLDGLEDRGRGVVARLAALGGGGLLGAEAAGREEDEDEDPGAHDAAAMPDPRISRCWRRRCPTRAIAARRRRTSRGWPRSGSRRPPCGPA